MSSDSDGEFESLAAAAAHLNERRWAKLGDLQPGEQRVEHTPAKISKLAGRELWPAAGGFVFATSSALYTAVDTWKFGQDRGAQAPFLEIVRIPFSEIASVKVAGYHMSVEDKARRGTKAELYPSPFSVAVADAVTQCWRQATREARSAPPSRASSRVVDWCAEQYLRRVESDEAQLLLAMTTQAGWSAAAQMRKFHETQWPRVVLEAAQRFGAEAADSVEEDPDAQAAALRRGFSWDPGRAQSLDSVIQWMRRRADTRTASERGNSQEAASGLPPGYDPNVDFHYWLCPVCIESRPSTEKRCPTCGSERQ